MHLKFPSVKWRPFCTGLDELKETSCYKYWIEVNENIFNMMTSWRGHILMTSSNGNIFRVTGPLCEEFTGHRWIPRTKAVTRHWCFLYLRLNKRLSVQSWGWLFGTLSRSIWRHCNVLCITGSDAIPANTQDLAIHIQMTWHLTAASHRQAKCLPKLYLTNANSEYIRWPDELIQKSHEIPRYLNAFESWLAKFVVGSWMYRRTKASWHHIYRPIQSMYMALALLPTDTWWSHYNDVTWASRPFKSQMTSRFSSQKSQ